jgi:UTP--glucose-1-phosphate uridylyltransferase
MSRKKQVKKVVIPAAGLGTRFFPITKAQPKEMLPVVDKPVIQYVVEEAIASGIDDILIITGRGKRAIEDHFDRSIELELKLAQSKNTQNMDYFIELTNSVNIYYIRQREAKGLGDAILSAEKHCDDEPFAVLLGDTITIPTEGSPTCTRQMMEAFEKFQKTIIAIEPVPRQKIKDYGIISGREIEPNTYFIENIVEKPNPDEVSSNLGAIGRYILTTEIFDHLKNCSLGHGEEIQLTDALQKVKDRIGLITDCKRYDIGDKLGWMKSSIELTLQREEFSQELREYLNNILRPYDSV